MRLKPSILILFLLLTGRASALEAPNLGETLEFRMSTRSLRSPKPLFMEVPLQVDGVEDGASRLELKSTSMGFDGSGFGFQQFQLMANFAKWSFQKKPIINLRCQNIRIEYRRDVLSLALPSALNVTFHIQFKEKKAFIEDEHGAVLHWMRSQLGTLFTREVLDRSLILRADCPGGSNTVKVLRDLLLARLSDWPSKDPQLVEDLRRSFVDWLNENFKTLIFAKESHLLSREDSLKFALQFEVQKGVLVFRSPRNQALSSASRLNMELIQKDLRDGEFLIVIRPELLDAMIAQLPKDVVLFQMAMKKEDLLAFFPSELRGWSENDGVSMSVVLPAIRQGESLQSSTKFFLSEDAASASAEWNSVLLFRFQNEQKKELSFERHAWVRFENGIGEARSLKVTWLDKKEPWNQRQALPTELGVSLQWILNSQYFEDQANKLLGGFLRFGRAFDGVDYFLLGEASEINLRKDGGFWGEALVLKTKY